MESLRCLDRLLAAINAGPHGEQRDDDRVRKTRNQVAAEQKNEKKAPRPLPTGALSFARADRGA